ncbi:hypothetical protein Pcinc_043719, partial [Petrolisthes cinctipes]
AKLSAKDIRCLGLSTQRASFVTWNKNTDKLLHKFITWKDVRSDALVKQWNRSIIMKLIRFGSSILYKILRSKRFLAGSVLKLMNIQVNMRLKWVLENNVEAARLAREGDLLFGTLDTWLIYKLSKGKIHATDYSNASGTALYDPFIEDWNRFFLGVFGIPLSIFPELRPSVGNWGSCSADLFGAEIPITAVVSDQGASLFGSFGFERGDVKITLGTGAFMDVNTGSKPHASVKGIYPVHGWKDSQGLVHMAEASSNDNGTVIEWGQTMGLYENASETSDLAMSAKGDNSVYFIPAFQGIQAPLNDARATAGILGLSANTGRPQLVRAMLESLAFRVHQMYSAMRAEADYDLLNIRPSPLSSADPVERPKSTDVTALGTAFLAGMGAGVWESRDELLPLYSVDRVFQPEMEHQPQLLQQMKEWERALKRFTKWHCEDNSSTTKGQLPTTPTFTGNTHNTTTPIGKTHNTTTPTDNTHNTTTPTDNTHNTTTTTDNTHNTTTPTGNTHNTTTPTDNTTTPTNTGNTTTPTTTRNTHNTGNHTTTTTTNRPQEKFTAEYLSGICVHEDINSNTVLLVVGALGPRRHPGETGRRNERRRDIREGEKKCKKERGRKEVPEGEREDEKWKEDQEGKIRKEEQEGEREEEQEGKRKEDQEGKIRKEEQEGEREEEQEGEREEEQEGEREEEQEGERETRGMGRKEKNRRSEKQEE